MKRKANIETRRTTASAMHRHILKLTREAFAGLTVKEEQTIDGPDGKLFVDILIKELSVCIECHGRQHYEFVPHFHGTQEKFQQQKQRDQHKAEAIENADHTLVAIRFDEYESMTPLALSQLVLKTIQEQSS